MRTIVLLSFFAIGMLHAVEKPLLIVVTGARGAEEYGQNFRKWVDQWKVASDQAKVPFKHLGEVQEGTAKSVLREILADQPKQSLQPLWIVLIGHGTYGGKKAKFNLLGPDLEAGELGKWLKDFERPLIIINCSSSSSPFLNALSAKGRVVITATRSGFEQNFCHLGGFLSEAISDANADLDKDGQTSLLEAWLLAARRTAAFYKERGRLATEHSLLDDNGDGKGTPSDWFRGLALTKSSAEAGLSDGLRAHQIHLIPSGSERELTIEQRNRRNALELSMARLRASKKKIKEEEYYKVLEKLLLQMGQIYFDSIPKTDTPQESSQQ